MQRRYAGNLAEKLADEVVEAINSGEKLTKGQRAQLMIAVNDNYPGAVAKLGEDAATDLAHLALLYDAMFAANPLFRAAAAAQLLAGFLMPPDQSELLPNPLPDGWKWVNGDQPSQEWINYQLNQGYTYPYANEEAGFADTLGNKPGRELPSPASAALMNELGSMYVGIFRPNNNPDYAVHDFWGVGIVARESPAAQPWPNLGRIGILWDPINDAVFLAPFRNLGILPNGVNSVRELTEYLEELAPVVSRDPSIVEGIREIPTTQPMATAGRRLLAVNGHTAVNNGFRMRAREGVKERKTLVQKVIWTTLQILGAQSEVKDAIEAIYKALPKRLRAQMWVKNGKHEPSWKKKAGILLENFDKIDIQRAIAFLILSNVDDYLAAKQSQVYDQKLQRMIPNLEQRLAFRAAVRWSRRVTGEGAPDFETQFGPYAEQYESLERKLSDLGVLDYVGRGDDY